MMSTLDVTLVLLEKKNQWSSGTLNKPRICYIIFSTSKNYSMSNNSFMNHSKEINKMWKGPNRVKIVVLCMNMHCVCLQ